MDVFSLQTHRGFGHWNFCGRGLPWVRNRCNLRKAKIMRLHFAKPASNYHWSINTGPYVHLPYLPRVHTSPSSPYIYLESIHLPRGHTSPSSPYISLESIHLPRVHTSPSSPFIKTWLRPAYPRRAKLTTVRLLRCSVLGLVVTTIKAAVTKSLAEMEVNFILGSLNHRLSLYGGFWSY
jgi:hypothetical protein